MRFITLRFTLITMTVLFFASSLAISKELSLDDCIETALNNRASIVMSRGAEDLAKWNHRWAIGQFLPSVDGSYSYTKGKDTEIDPPNIGSGAETIDEQDIGPNKRWNLSGGISVFNLSNWYNYFGAKASKEAAHLDVIASEQSLIYSVKLAYYAYLAATENIATQEQAVERAQEQLKLIESKFDLGSASLSDVLKQKVQFGNDKLALLTARNLVVSTKATLAYTVGIDPSSDVSFSSVYQVREFDGTLNQALEFGLTHEPTLLSSEKQLSSAKHAARSRKSEYLPKVRAFADYSWFEGTQAFPDVFDYSFNNRTIGFVVSLNIFDGFSREREVSRAKINRNNAMANVAERRNLVSQIVKTAYLEIEQFNEAKTVASENVGAATEDLKITQEKYNLGAATILDLLDAQVSLKEAQVSLIRAGFDLNLAVAKLELSMGKM